MVPKSVPSATSGVTSPSVIGFDNPVISISGDKVLKALNLGYSELLNWLIGSDAMR